MKRTVILIIITIFSLGLFAQENTTVVTTIHGDGYAYIKEINDGTLKVKLYNKGNEYANVPYQFLLFGK